MAQEAGTLAETIRDSNPERAREAMRRHIDNVRSRLFEGKAGGD